MSFLPDDYQIPETAGNYMKFAEGENRFRILAKPVLGWEYWIDENDKRKPIRLQLDESAPVEYAEFVKHFWAMPVYNYQTKSIQVLEITQKGIMRALTALGKNKAWGSPLDYTLIVTRDGEGIESKYEVLPEPKEPLDQAIITKWNDLQALGFDMEKLFKGEHPHPQASDKPLETKPDRKLEAVNPAEEVDLDSIPF